MDRLRAAVITAASLGSLLSAGSAAQSRIVDLSFAEAAPIINALRSDLVPSPLRVSGAAERSRAFTIWAAARRTELRERLIRGDEDSIVNLFWFGVSYTRQPRLTPGRLAVLDRGASDAIFRARLDDLTAGILAPADNERLQFARAVAKTRGVAPAAPGARDRVHQYLVSIVDRSLSELAAFRQADGAQSTLYRGRGLSSDTSLLVDFSLERALEGAAAQDFVKPRSMRRIAVVGPGLDFIDKEGGYDFYPPQTIQPFAVVDSLMRVGLASPILTVTTLDVNERVNDLLRSVAARAQQGAAYTIHLPLDADRKWNPPLVAFWERFGDRIGSPTTGPTVPEGSGTVTVRSVAVRPEIVGVVHPFALNVVLQRLSFPPAERFDLVIATNILLYYDVFEQSLALANIAAMLKPGGLLLASDFVYPLPAVPMTIVGDTRVSYEGAAIEDVIIWYRRD